MTSNKLHRHEKKNCIEVDMVQSCRFLHLFLHPLFLFMFESLNLSLVLFSLLFLFFFSRCLKVLKAEFQKDLSKKYGIKALKYLDVE